MVLGQWNYLVGLSNGWGHALTAVKIHGTRISKNEPGGECEAREARMGLCRMLPADLCRSGA